MRTLQDIQREENCGMAKALRIQATQGESSLAQAPGSVIYLLTVSGAPRGWTDDPIWAGRWASQLRERDALPMKEIMPLPNDKLSHGHPTTKKDTI